MRKLPFMPHRVTIEQVQDFKVVQEIAGSHGPDENKWLNVVATKGGLEYHVINTKPQQSSRMVQLITPYLQEAIDKYNSI